MCRIAIIGMGALGVMYAQRFTETLGSAQVAVLADGERIKRYEKDGFFCNGKACEFTYRTPEQLKEAPELLIFAVKYRGLAAAIETVRDCVGENTLILSLLNGISSEEMLIEAFGEEKVVYCVAQKMDAQKSGNQAQYVNMGELAVGELHGGMTPRVRRVEAILDQAQIPYVLPEDMEQLMWSKLLCNTGVNQTTMIFEGCYEMVQRPGKERDLMIEAMKEVIAVARARGINLTERDMEEWVAVLDQLDPKGETSMRQDGRHRRKTEVELFSGTIRRLGREMGIATPVNDQYYRKIKEMEAEWS